MRRRYYLFALNQDGSFAKIDLHPADKGFDELEHAEAIARIILTGHPNHYHYGIVVLAAVSVSFRNPWLPKSVLLNEDSFVPVPNLPHDNQTTATAKVFTD